MTASSGYLWVVEELNSDAKGEYWGATTPAFFTRQEARATAKTYSTPTRIRYYEASE